MLGPIFLLGALAVITRALICTIVGTDLIILGNLRESTLQTAEADLARYSLTLAENAGPITQITGPGVVERRRLTHPRV
jgi:hypothetical protein